MAPVAAILEMKRITKIYGDSVVANRSVDFEVEQGEIHALVGENGAGKSTLMKVLFGLEEPSEGEIFFKGKKARIGNPHHAIALGIGMVHQHFMLVPSLTVAENLVLGMEPRRALGMIDLQKAREQTEALSKEYGLAVDPAATIESISVGKRQRVEILKTLYRGAELLILDEPTAVLTPQETDELFAALRSLVSQGRTIIFITHKLREVMEISDRVTVMRAGRKIGTVRTSETSKEEISRMMVGRDVLLRVEKTPANPREIVLDMDKVDLLDQKGRAALQQVSLQVRAGEILGIAGVEGNGQTELVEVLTGLRRATSGKVKISGKDVTDWDPRRLRELGLGHIPEDRHRRGTAVSASIEENLILDSYYRPPKASGWLLKVGETASYAVDLVRRYDVRTNSAKNPAGSLSGGNLQKVVIAREFSKDPKLLVAAQPTRGVDIGAIEFIHREVIKRRDEGSAVLLISADLGEVMSLSDRIAVMYGGQVVAIFDDAASVTEEELGLYMLGVKRQAELAGEVAG